MNATDAMEYYMALENAQNEALILNIHRARDGRPPYFTNLISFTGRSTASVSLSLSNQKTCGLTVDRVTTWGPSTTVGAITRDDRALHFALISKFRLSYQALDFQLLPIRNPNSLIEGEAFISLPP